MIHTLTIEGREFGLELIEEQLNIYADGAHRGSMYVAVIEPEPEPVFVEPDAPEEGGE